MKKYIAIGYFFLNIKFFFANFKQVGVFQTSALSESNCVLRVYPDREIAKIFFDVCRSFFDLFLLFFDILRFRFRFLFHLV